MSLRRAFSHHRQPAGPSSWLLDFLIGFRRPPWSTMLSCSTHGRWLSLHPSWRQFEKGSNCCQQVAHHFV